MSEGNLKAMFKKYKDDLDRLIKKGDHLYLSMQYECHPVEFKKQIAEHFENNKEKTNDFLKTLPKFNSEYQMWYSESVVTIKQLLPDRLDDFVRLFEKPKNRKSIEYGNYVLADYLQNLRVTFGDHVKVDKSAALNQFEQQLNIVKSVQKRFESSLFDIRQLAQADLFDSELEAARELLKNKFGRAAGAMAGVVLEAHLEQVATNHHLSLAKKNPSISDWNDLLKNNNVVDTSQWRLIQHLGDLRNLCDHKKTKEPTHENVEDLIVGVDKITKTLF